MPKSKRDQKVTLSRTVKKGRDRKLGIMEEVRSCVDKYSNCYVFAAEGMRNAALKDVRAVLKSSRIFFGRNKLIAAALGRTVSDEYREGLSAVAGRLVGGERGILFTDEPYETIVRVIEESRVPEYARAGFVATRAITLDEGPMPQFPHSMEPYLRKLGLPTRLQSGVVHLLTNWPLCREGEELNSDHAKLLQLLDIKMSEFKLSLLCHWSAAGEFREF